MRGIDKAGDPMYYMGMRKHRHAWYVLRRYRIGWMGTGGWECVERCDSCGKQRTRKEREERKAVGATLRFHQEPERLDGRSARQGAQSGTERFREGSEYNDSTT